jgi:hypothetical protein
MRATLSTAPPRPSGPSAGKPPRRDRFAREIAAVLVVKAIAIIAIWLAFFSAPPVPSGSLDAQRMAEHIAPSTGIAHGRP